MMLHPTLDKLRDLRLDGMLAALNDQEMLPNPGVMSFEERLGLLVDREITTRENRKLKIRLGKAKLRQEAAMEDLYLRPSREIDRSQILALSSCEWIRRKENCIITGKTGPEICSDLREYKINTPILILSVQSDIQEKIKLLNCGADDYLAKPFSYKELSARAQALLRRPPIVEGKKLSVGDLSLDRTTYSAMRGDKTIRLTPKEFSLLEYLIKNQGKVVSRKMILEHVWDDIADPFSNNIETHITNLRKKIDRGRAKKLIHTAHGQGYKISA